VSQCSQNVGIQWELGLLNGYTHWKRFAQWTLNTKTVQFWLLPDRFIFPTLYFDSPRSLFDYLPEPIKERSLLSRESQQRQPPLPMRFPPGYKALRHRSLPHPDLRHYEATIQIHETTFLPMRASLDSFILQRNSPSRYDQVVQHLPMTMKMVAKGILKDHLVPMASSTTCSGNLNGFNNAGYKATSRPLKVQVPLTESTLFTPMECMRRLQRNVILIHWDVWSHHVRGASMQYLTLSYLLRLCNENQLKSNKEFDDDLYDFLALMKTDQKRGLDTHSWKMYNNQEGYQNRMVSWKNWRSEWYKEATMRWRTSKDDDNKVELMRGYPLSLIFWMTQGGDNSSWSSDWTKEWLLSVQSSSTTTPLIESPTIE
jgi:hypothetical protein